jgi:lipopolysaccharide biosynthesis protein
MLPSLDFQTKEPGWVHPNLRPEFLSLRIRTAKARVAVVLHVFYPELWPEMRDALKNITESFDLFVTLVVDVGHVKQQITSDYPDAVVIEVDNHGRDVLPFILLLKTNVLFQYELLCKVHTKRSSWHKDGDAWRRDLVAGVLGSPTIVEAIIDRFRSDRDLGIVVADGHIYSGLELWVGNRSHLRRFFENFAMDEREFTKSFAGGSIFWTRPSILRAVAQMAMSFDDFEPEPLGADGGFAHAIERLHSLICYDSGMYIAETSTILRT